MTAATTANDDDNDSNSSKVANNSVLLGTCGWSYQEWVGAFYPNNRVAKLPFYARVFQTVEVDSSFYRAPSKAMVKGWERATPPSFTFSLKVPKTVTHDKRLAGAQREFLSFLEVIKPLEDAGKLGCLLVQLPPSFTYEEGRRSLESFLADMPAHLHFAVEFRHESWDRQESFDLLARYGVANTITDSPLEFLSRPIVTAGTHSYVRWHGRGRDVWFDYTYSEDELWPWVKRLDEISAKAKTTYAYFNNHYHSSAPINALQLLEMGGMITGPQLALKEKIDKRSARRESKKARITDYV
ncbi:DUF72 domain-containing protein [Nitrososphaera sp.]|uniref:DUF72 domain-containing protein n=1 Tax=Nitrososphaera sp. TaxID=1971748 RepID=UPI00307EF422